MFQRLALAVACLALLFSQAFAVFVDDAYNVDYHLALLGLPRQQATFFHQPHYSSKASLLFTLSERNVLGAVNPKDGTLVWRQRLQPASSATAGFLRAGEDTDTVVTAVHGEVAAWSASDGRIAWKTALGDVPVLDLELLELPTGQERAEDGKDAAVLVGGTTSFVKRLNATTGRVKWEYEDTSGDAPLQVSASSTSIYYISTHSTFTGGLKIKVTSLDPLDGHKIDQYTISSDGELASADDILFVGANTASPIIAWTDKTRKTVKINILGSKSVSTFAVESSAKEEVERITLHASHKISSLPHFLIHYQTSERHWAEVFHINPNSASITKAYSLPKLAGKGVFATTPSDANVYFTRVTEDEFSVVSSASHGILGRWPRKSKQQTRYSTAFAIHASAEVVSKSGSVSAIRCAVLHSDGSWVLYRNGELIWARHEGLASATAAIWAETDDGSSLTEELEAEGHANPITAYVHRLNRHIHDLQYLPSWLQSIFKTLFLGSAQGTKGDITAQAVSTHDRFGFHKLVLVANDAGYLYLLDAGDQGALLSIVQAVELAPGKTWTSPDLRISPEGQLTAVDPSTGSPNVIRTPLGDKLRSPRFPNSGSVDQQPLSVLVSLDSAHGEIHGRQASVAETVWRFKPSAGERIVQISDRVPNEPVAAIGKALGDRRVLYKYLNLNLLLVLAANDAANRLAVYLLDSVSGDVVYDNTHDGVDTARSLTSALSENWFTYSFSTIPSSKSPLAGQELVIAELYESYLPNDRGPLGSTANYSALDNGSARPYVIAQTYHVTEEISSMAITQTRQGITSRELLAVLSETNSIVSIPRYQLDPRRPVDRDATKIEAAEGLFKYSPVLEFDPKWYINHRREVEGVKHVITTPSGVESTSLVFAYGGDIFGTRVSPSGAFDVLGKDFGKLQMLATVAALGVGVFVVAPLVRAFKLLPPSMLSSR
ncbi:MAG: hypothetical protein M1822_006167 [Bathelium mastoideum]|nr:MAG: hypothetical protein M1822_006167 [Bathelium mastoideum]